VQPFRVEQPHEGGRVDDLVCPPQFGGEPLAPVVGERHDDDGRCAVLIDPPRVDHVPGQLTLEDAFDPPEQLTLPYPPDDEDSDDEPRTRAGVQGS
jgi:hypothetical protein